MKSNLFIYILKSQTKHVILIFRLNYFILVPQNGSKQSHKHLIHQFITLKIQPLIWNSVLDNDSNIKRMILTQMLYYNKACTFLYYGDCPMVWVWGGEEEAQHLLQQVPGGGGVQHTHWIHITLLTAHQNKLDELLIYHRK